MKRFSYALLICIVTTLIFPACSASASHIKSKDVAISINGKLKGSGAFVESGKILTAAHVLAADGRISITVKGGVNYAASTVKVDLEKDLALLELNPKHSSSFYKLGDETGITFTAKGSTVDKQFQSFSGSVLATYIPTTMWDHVKGVYNEERERNVFAIPALPGFSGGALLDENDELEGIIIGGDTENLYAATMEDILNFMYACELD